MKSIRRNEVENFESDNALRWYVVYCHPRQEGRAESNLRAGHIETFFPQIKEHRPSIYTGKPSTIIKPLFPRYLFVRFRIKDSIQKVVFARGVNSIVSFGDGPPIPVEDEVIAFIQSKRKRDGYIRLVEKIEPGDKVVVNNGPFRNLTGMFEEATAARRVSILLSSVCFQGRLIIDRDSIKKVDVKRTSSRRETKVMSISAPEN